MVGRRTKGGAVSPDYDGVFERVAMQFLLGTFLSWRNVPNRRMAALVPNCEKRIIVRLCKNKEA